MYFSRAVSAVPDRTLVSVHSISCRSVSAGIFLTVSDSAQQRGIDPLFCDHMDHTRIRYCFISALCGCDCHISDFLRYHEAVFYCRDAVIAAAPYDSVFCVRTNIQLKGIFYEKILF